MKWVLAAAWAVFVVGGFVAGWTSLRDFAWLAQVASARSGVETRSTRSLQAPSATPAPLAHHPPLRDFDQSPPPFAASPPHGEATPQASSPVGRLTVLLMGIDQRPDEAVPGGDPGRTDTMVLVSVDYDAHTATMISIPRDGFVVIPEHGNERLNAAYTFGEIDKRGSGPALAKRHANRGGLGGAAVGRDDRQSAWDPDHGAGGRWRLQHCPRSSRA